jgi:hypothetical protein
LRLKKLARKFRDPARDSIPRSALPLVADWLFRRSPAANSVAEIPPAFLQGFREVSGVVGIARC